MELVTLAPGPSLSNRSVTSAGKGKRLQPLDPASDNSTLPAPREARLGGLGEPPKLASFPLISISTTQLVPGSANRSSFVPFNS